MSDKNDNNNNINTKDLLIGSLLGGAIGALAGLLLAPKSGRELRQDLGVQTQNLKEKSSGYARKLSDQSSNLVDKTKEFAGNFRKNDDAADNVPDEVFEKEPIDLSGEADEPEREQL